MISCQKCRQPLSPSSFVNYLPPSSSSSARHPASAPSHLPPIDDSLAALSPSTYDFLSASERFPSAAQPPNLRPLYNLAARSLAPSTAQRIVVTAPHPHQHANPAARASGPGGPPLGPAESFVVLSDSVFRPQQPGPPLPSPSVPSTSSPSTSAASTSPTSLLPRLAQLSHLSALLSSSSSVDHPLCTECIEVLLQLMAKELDEGKRERDRLSAFEKDVAKRRNEAKLDGSVVGKEVLEKDIAKKDALEAEKLALDEEEAELAREEAEFWREHSKYVLEKSALEDRANALAVRLASGQKELDKLGRTNVYNDAFCIGQEAGFGTINGLRLGRLPGVEWPEINAAWGHTLLLLSTIARKFGFSFQGYRLVPCGSFSRVERTDGDRASYELCVLLFLLLPLLASLSIGSAGFRLTRPWNGGHAVHSYGSGDFAVTRLLQNRRFDLAMVAFLDCLRQLSEWVVSRDRGARVLCRARRKPRLILIQLQRRQGPDRRCLDQAAVRQRRGMDESTAPRPARPQDPPRPRLDLTRRQPNHHRSSSSPPVPPRLFFDPVAVLSWPCLLFTGLSAAERA
ncbi:SPOSA6832_04077, partial [Sporobolomyces salmonicolor]